MKYLSFLSIILIISLTVRAQEKLSTELQNGFTLWQKGKPINQAAAKVITFDKEDAVKETEKYSMDTSSAKRYFGYTLLHYIGNNLKDSVLRRRIIKQLVKGCNDKDGGIVGFNLKCLTAYSRTDFDPEMKYMLSQMVNMPFQHFDMLVKICGWLNISDLMYDFRKAITEKQRSARDCWYMRIALARMGDIEMTEFCLQKLKRTTINDDIVNDIIPDLIYTRRKPLYDALLDVIESDEKNCSSPNPDSDAKILCAYSVIQQIAPYIENFPAKINASGDIETRNSEKTLVEVRSWIKEHKDNYVIKEERF